MSSGIQNRAYSNYGMGSGQAGRSFGNANAIYGNLEPQLAAEAAHPSGYTPAQVAQQNTAAQQSAGGSMSGATGQGALLAARTRNAGAAQGAIQESGRQAGQRLSNAALNIQGRNADLQQRQKQEALAGLGALGSQQGQLGLGALGQSNQALKVAEDYHPFWQSVVLQAMSNAEKAASGGAAGF